jgi:type IV secretion system protein VirB10
MWPTVSARAGGLAAHRVPRWQGDGHWRDAGRGQRGYAGFNDQVNNHYVRLFGSAFLMSGVTAGITYSQRQNQATNTYGAPSASSALSEALGQQLGQVTAQLIAKNLSISPTLEIRPGYRFNVVVTKDMTFSKPYRSFDY